MVCKNGRKIAVLMLFVFTATFLMTMFPLVNQEAQAAQATQTATVIGEKVNIRKGPSANYDIVRTVSKGIKLEVLKFSKGWYNVRMSNGQAGWVAGWLVSVQNVKAFSQGSTQQQSAVVNVSKTVIRSGPGLNYSRIAYGYQGKRFDIVGQQGTWYKISLTDGRQAWIAKAGIKIENPNLQLPSPVEELKKLVISGATLVNIRTGPGTNYDLVATLPEGTEMTELKFENNWHNVRLKDGREGWIIATYVKEQVTTPGHDQPPASRGGDKPLDGKVIVVDPGHSSINSWGIDPGASGSTGLTERVVVLDIALKLRDILSSLGAKVIMTHTGTTTLSLQGRADIANNANADLFISVHANANLNPAISGTSTYYFVNSEMSPTLSSARAKLAQSIQTEMVGLLKTRNIGILTANFKVIVATTMPSVLVETAFLSNPTEEVLLATEAFRLKCAQAIALGIEKYFQ